MCGRLACSLKPREVCISCCYKEPGTKQYKTPLWKDSYNSGKTYKPSYNVCPTEVAPVLLSGSHFQLESRLVLPKVSREKLKENFVFLTNINKYSTINCRIETIQNSKLYENLLEKNQRCVVICNGFYEWQNQFSSKKPFFVHSKQENEIRIDDPKTWNLEFTLEEGFNGFKPLKLAALFQINSFQMLEDATFSFTIIISSETSWLHERVPAILETDEQLNIWLNCKEIGGQVALASLTHSYQLMCFPISKWVNSIANKDISCIQKEKASGESSGNKSSAGFLKDWLKDKNEKVARYQEMTINNKEKDSLRVKQTTNLLF